MFINLPNDSNKLKTQWKKILNFNLAFTNQRRFREKENKNQEVHFKERKHKIFYLQIIINWKGNNLVGNS